MRSSQSASTHSGYEVAEAFGVHLLVWDKLFCKFYLYFNHAVLKGKLYIFIN